jgi:hypothetical protein
MSNEAPVDEDLDGIRVVRVVGLGDEHGSHGAADSVNAEASSEVPEVILVVRLADDLERVAPPQQGCTIEVRAISPSVWPRHPAQHAIEESHRRRIRHCGPILCNPRLLCRPADTGVRHRRGGLTRRDIDLATTAAETIGR